MVMTPVFIVVFGSLLAYQLGVTSLQPSMDALTGWLNSAPRSVDMVLIVSPAIAFCLAAAPLLRFDVTIGSSGREARLGVRLRAANVVVGLVALAIGALLVWHIVFESVMQVGP
jgi:hypothetical protein